MTRGPASPVSTIITESPWRQSSLELSLGCHTTLVTSLPASMTLSRSVTTSTSLRSSSSPASVSGSLMIAADFRQPAGPSRSPNVERKRPGSLGQLSMCHTSPLGCRNCLLLSWPLSSSRMIL